MAFNHAIKKMESLIRCLNKENWWEPRTVSIITGSNRFDSKYSHIFQQLMNRGKDTCTDVWVIYALRKFSCISNILHGDAFLNFSVCKHKYVYMHIYIYININTHVYIYIYVYMSYIFLYMYICIYMYIIKMYIYIYTYTYMYIYFYIQICMFMYIYMCTYI